MTQADDYWSLPTTPDLGNPFVHPIIRREVIRTWIDLMEPWEVDHRYGWALDINEKIYEQEIMAARAAIGSCEIPL